MNVTLVGNLTEDPELRYTNAGTAYARMRVAENSRWKGQDGTWQERSSFHTVVAWRELAENAAGSLRKGTRVVVVGRQEDRSFTAEDGTNRTVKEITADDIAPSLRWATAEVTKVNGSGSSDQRRGDTVAASSGEGFDPYNPF